MAYSRSRKTTSWNSWFPGSPSPARADLLPDDPIGRPPDVTPALIAAGEHGACLVGHGADVEVFLELRKGRSVGVVGIREATRHHLGPALGHAFTCGSGRPATTRCSRGRGRLAGSLGPADVVHSGRSDRHGRGWTDDGSDGRRSGRKQHQTDCGGESEWGHTTENRTVPVARHRHHFPTPSVRVSLPTY